MNIASFLGTSFIDYPGNISLVIFTKGCNMNCPYCHNKNLETKFELINEKIIFDLLIKRKNLIDAVTISGGEPTLQSDLYGFCFAIKEMGYKIKLDTNGTNPKILKDLIDNKLVDYIAMDIKTSPDKYNELCGKSFDSIKNSIKLIQSFKNHEFRTTFYPSVSKNDIKEILKYTNNSPYYLQQYRKINDDTLKAYSDEFVLDIGNEFNIFTRNTDII